VSRFIVTELEGWTIGTSGKTSGAAKSGISCHVIDTHWNHRLMATYRSDGYLYRYHGRDGVRKKAREHAERLNAAL